MDVTLTTVYRDTANPLDYPYRVDHSISWLGPEWSKMNEWLRENVGEKGQDWVWFVSSCICFRTPEHALTFAVIWGGV